MRISDWSSDVCSSDLRMDLWSVREYKAVKIYHRLEKSLSFRERRGQSGIGAARELIRHLDKRGKAGTNFTFHEKVGFKVLGDYVDSANAPISDENVVAVRNRYAPEALDFGGIREIGRASCRERVCQYV